MGEHTAQDIQLEGTRGTELAWRKTRSKTQWNYKVFPEILWSCYGDMQVLRPTLQTKKIIYNYLGKMNYAFPHNYCMYCNN